jgi:hypothetical protein
VNVNPADPAKGYPRAWQWGTNLIGYDALRSFGSPSYYAQAMLAQNRGDVILPAELRVPPVPPIEQTPRGAIGVGSWHTEVEYKEISVTAKRGDTAYGICSTDFLEQAFRTDAYRCDITFNDDGSWTYLIQTELFVRGAPFNHRDTNTLKLVAPPKLNPLAVIVNGRATGNEKGNEPAA